MTTNHAALWFSRHPMTGEQRQEISDRFGDPAIIDAADLAARNINSAGDLREVVSGVESLVRAHNVGAIFGVLAAPVAAEAFQSEGDESVALFAAWNVNRTPDGERPTFRHAGFVRVGNWMFTKSAARPGQTGQRAQSGEPR